jgi:hypothetical protein
MHRHETKIEKEVENLNVVFSSFLEYWTMHKVQKPSNYVFQYSSLEGKEIDIPLFI